MPLSTLLNARRCECLWPTWPCFFLLGRGLASCLRITCCLSGYLYCQERWAPFPYRERLDALLSHYLTCLFRQDRTFFLLGPVDDRFHAASAQCDPTIPSSALLAPPISSPCLEVNEEIDLRMTGSPDCLTLQLCQTKQM